MFVYVYLVFICIFMKWVFVILIHVVFDFDLCHKVYIFINE